MYLKPQFEETRIDVLHEIARAHPLGTFIALTDAGVSVDHMPFVLSAEGGNCGTLRSHVPRSNPVWTALNGDVEAVTVFHGPDSYIRPSWYPSKQVHGKVAPTWNFVVVHARGKPTAIDDADWLLRHLNELTDEHESEHMQPWKVADAPDDYRDSMISRLVGIEMPIDSMVGKWKVSQNRPLADRRGVADGLRLRGDEASMAMERLVRERLPDGD